MAYDAFMFLKGINGESTADIPMQHGVKPFEIFSFSWGASNPTTVGSHGGGLAGGKVSVSSFNVMKRSDKSSPLLFSYCCKGEHINNINITLRKAGGTQQPFIQYEFEDNLVESIQWSGSTGGDDTPTESLSFAFSRCSIKYLAQDSKTGKTSVAGEASWDLTKVKV